jgi:hypothetical protein
MIILEGPDGSGKTSLMGNLLDRLQGVEQHERASTSKGGPVDNLFDWAQEDVLTWPVQPLAIYDRHPLFSEPIYGPIIRQTLDPRFNSPVFGRVLTQQVLKEGLIVICLPDPQFVIDNVRGNADDQMEGVLYRIESIYSEYRRIQHNLRGRRNVFWYDYNRNGDLEQLVTVAKAHQIMWNKNRGIHG